MKTIKDIAEEANVSVGTVDRVIHKRNGVSPVTRAKVQLILKKHNFKRNVLASTLAYKKSYTIAVMLPSSDSKFDFWIEPIKGIETAIDEIRRYKVETLCFYFDKLNLASYKQTIKRVLDLNPDGLVLAPFFYSTSIEFTSELNQRNIPYVFFNIDIESQQNLTFIGQESFQSGLISGKLLNMILGKQDHITILRSRKNVDTHHSIDARSKGFVEFYLKNSSPRTIIELYADDFNPEEIENILKRELSKNNLIKGIFVPSSGSSNVAKYIEKAEMKDMHLVGFDAHAGNLKYLESGTIDFLIDQDPFDQGYLGVKVLFEYLLFKKQPLKNYSSPINIVTKENARFFRKPSMIGITS